MWECMLCVTSIILNKENIQCCSMNMFGLDGKRALVVDTTVMAVMILGFFHDCLSTLTSTQPAAT